MGRQVSLLKTLIIPKLNNLVLALPMPNDYFRKGLESEMFEIPLKSKIHKIKKRHCFSRL